MGRDPGRNKKRISNIEQGMLNTEAICNLIIRNSLFDIRYSFRAYGKLIVLEVPTTKILAKHLPPICLLTTLPRLSLRRIPGRVHDSKLAIKPANIL
jgi:hypothetical protein